MQLRDPVSKKRDDFEDILEERRNSSDLRYALKCYTPAVYRNLVPCTASMLKNLVLESDALRYVINQVRALRGRVKPWITKWIPRQKGCRFKALSRCL